jgi:hypothetical protein
MITHIQTKSEYQKMIYPDQIQSDDPSSQSPNCLRESEEIALLIF